jgi:hypothetical protein
VFAVNAIPLFAITATVADRYIVVVVIGHPRLHGNPVIGVDRIRELLNVEEARFVTMITCCHSLLRFTVRLDCNT